MDSLSQGQYLTLDASGLAVGLPPGLMGNSEVGHFTIGTGRVVYQVRRGGRTWFIQAVDVQAGSTISLYVDKLHNAVITLLPHHCS